jgi:hypothetical protein
VEWGKRKNGTIKVEMLMKDGLYANIHAKRERIKAGSGEKMKKAGAKGAPSAEDFKESAKTARKDTIETAYNKYVEEK